MLTVFQLSVTKSFHIVFFSDDVIYMAVVRIDS